MVWTVGVRASTLTGQIPGERDAQGRLHVDRNLKVLGLDDVYATGDVARAAHRRARQPCPDSTATPSPWVARPAITWPPTCSASSRFPHSQVKYVTSRSRRLGRGAHRGLDRQVRFVREEGKKIKDRSMACGSTAGGGRAVALAAADPLIPVVA